MLGALILVLVVGAVAAALFARRGKSTVTQATQNVTAPQQRATVAPSQPTGGVGQKHLLVNPEWSFAQIERAMRTCDLPPTFLGDGPEPTAATFSDGTFTVSYRYDAELGFRGLAISGPADRLRGVVNDLVNLAYMSTMEWRLTEFLDPARPPRDLLYGLRGAEWIGKGEDHKYYWEKAGALRDHADPRVAAEARRVYDALLAEAGGKPVPSGPRGLPLVFEKASGAYVLVAAHKGTRFQLAAKAGGGFTLYMNDEELQAIDEWPEAWTR